MLILAFSSLLVASAFHSALTLRLDIDYASAEQSLAIYEGTSGRGETIALLRGSQLALATTSLLAGRSYSMADLVSTLDDARFGHTRSDDVFRIHHARERRADIKRLLDEMKRRNFGQRVVSTVEQLFPEDVRMEAVLPLYVVAFGHENIDAFVRRVAWDTDVPVFVGEGEGKPTIVVNIAKAVTYGPDLDAQFVGMLSVVAHEVFHAAFDIYKDQSPVWQSYHQHRKTFQDRLFDLTQNEGIAHYLSFEQRTGGLLPPDWNRRIETAFAEFNSALRVLRFPQTSPSKAHELILRSNTSGYWESFGAITGMFIAYQIDQTLGRSALVETLRNGPDDFFEKYRRIAESKSLPLIK